MNLKNLNLHLFFSRAAQLHCLAQCLPSLFSLLDYLCGNILSLSDQLKGRENFNEILTVWYAQYVLKGTHFLTKTNFFSRKQTNCRVIFYGNFEECQKNGQNTNISKRPNMLNVSHTLWVLNSIRRKEDNEHAKKD